MKKFAVRPSVESDMPYLFKVYEEAFRWRIEKVFAWDDHWHWRSFQKEWHMYETYVVEVDATIAGYYQIEWQNQALYLVNIAFLESFRGQGLGAKVMTNLKECVQLRKAELHLSVFKINTKAISFYNAQGFEVFRETDETFKMKWAAKLS